MRALDVRVKLNQIRCIEGGKGIAAESCLWTLFFKIDGETAGLSLAHNLRGAATVRGMPEGRGRLPDADPGEAIAIPSLVGEFNTSLRPIPLEVPAGNTREVGGVVGCVATLIEYGFSIAALDKALRDCLERLVPTLHLWPTEVGRAAMRLKIAAALTRAVEDGIRGWGRLEGLDNMDDRINGGVFCYDHAQLEQAVGTPGLEIYRRWRGGGDWELRGRVTAGLAWIFEPPENGIFPSGQP